MISFLHSKYCDSSSNILPWYLVLCDMIYIFCMYSGYSDVFVTSSKNDIRVWNTNTSKELLRITVPNMDCNAVAVTVDGKSIVSGRSKLLLLIIFTGPLGRKGHVVHCKCVVNLGWSDNKIRAYSPQTGKLIYTINDAHNKGVTAIATTNDGQHLISGGGEGQVRVWVVSAVKQRMEEAMKEHKGDEMLGC